MFCSAPEEDDTSLTSDSSQSSSSLMKKEQNRKCSRAPLPPSSSSHPYSLLIFSTVPLYWPSTPAKQKQTPNNQKPQLNKLNTRQVKISLNWTESEVLNRAQILTVTVWVGWAILPVIYENILLCSLGGLRLAGGYKTHLFTT